MKIIVSVQPKQGSSRGLVHYIAHSKIDERKERGTRALFSSNSDSMSVTKANDHLKTGVDRKRPGNDELHHLVISIKPEDFKRLGETEKERINSLKQITRLALKTLEKSINAESLQWAAGIHRNTSNPHVHVAIQKQFFDRDLQKKTLGKIPKECLPHYEKGNDEKIFKEGLLISTANQKFEEIVSQKSQERLHVNEGGNSRKPQPEEKFEISEKAQEINQIKDILAREILAKYFLKRAHEKRDSLITDGDKRRFLINDKLTNKKRRMSIFDLERRAVKRADRKIRKKKICDPEKKSELQGKLVSSEISKNSDAVKRIRTILSHLIIRENKEIERREKALASIKPKADEIRIVYRKQNKKLPAPNLAGHELDMLQKRSFEKGDVRTANFLERARRELLLEKKLPARTEKELRALKALQIISQIRSEDLEQQAKGLSNNKRNFPFEIGGKKWTLAKADLFLEKCAIEEKRIVGRVQNILGKTGLIKQKSTSPEIKEIRRSIIEKLDEKARSLGKDLRREKKISKTIDKILKAELSGENHELKAQFDASQLAEIESLAFRLKLVPIYKQNFEDQKRFIKASDSQKETFQTRELIAGRAIAREILSGIEVSRAKEELLFFKRNKNFQKFEVRDRQNFDPQFISLQEVRFDARGSVFDQTIEYLTESREKRKTRSFIEKQIKERGAEIKQNLKTAKEIHRAATEETKGYKQRSFFGGIKYDYPPVFTPKELIEIELRIEQTASRSEARELKKLLDSTDQARSKNLAAILNGPSAEKGLSQPERNLAKQKLQISQTVFETREKMIRSEQNLKIKLENQTKGR